MELRQLEAFAVLADELHFGRAAARLSLSQPTLSTLVRRLEREVGTPLFARTTRRVSLTEAGRVLLEHTSIVLADVAEARAAVAAVGAGERGLVRLGFTPSAAPVLVPHLVRRFREIAPGVQLEKTELWLTGLQDALAQGAIDVAVTCGLFDPTPGTETEQFAAEPLLVGLRPDHRLAQAASVDLKDLASDRLGMAPTFPAWTASQLHALDAAGAAPPIVALRRTNLDAVGWLDQPDVDWVLLTPSLTSGHVGDVVRPVHPPRDVAFVVQWRPVPAPVPAVTRFVRHVLEAPLAAGWSRIRGRL